MRHVRLPALKPDANSPHSLTCASIYRIGGFVGGWLDAKKTRPRGAKTVIVYRNSMRDFRAALHRIGLDLDVDPATLVQAAEIWASLDKYGRPVAAKTFSQRLGILSSFYEYAVEQTWWTSNPIDLIDRHTDHRELIPTPLNPKHRP